ncbi:MAG: hypothetical protein KAG94_03825 [Clostridiales bacterium]|nr:hypothetical protein [Clostridiales bacterium]
MKKLSKTIMFVDNSLIEYQKGTSLKLHEPKREERVLSFDLPYECSTSGYVTILPVGKQYYLYYRGISVRNNSKTDYEVTCLAISNDGIHFDKPSFNMVEFNGNKDNNIILKDSEICHNFTPFIDNNPNCKEHQKFKAVGGHKRIGINKAKLYGLYSSDGIHFTKIKEEPILTDGMFDSQNVVFYDCNIDKYRCYSRYFSNNHLDNPKEYEGIRAIQSCESNDFIHWSTNVKNSYDFDNHDEFYTNATTICPETNTYLSFPKRYVKNRERDFFNAGDTGVSDGVFMSSHDGILWHRPFMEAYVRPGLDRENWVNRNNMMALGIINNNDKEFSMYISEHYRTSTAGIRRLSIRKHGFASIHANYQKGEMMTKPFLLSKGNLYINYATSAIGYVIIHLLDENKNKIASSLEMYGDEISDLVKFDNDYKDYYNKPVRLLFELLDSDLYALTFKEDIL